MSKYKKSLIFKYMSGDDVSPYDIDELEKDSEFIIEVIKAYKDKSMFNYLDNELLSNKELIEYFITTFKNDIQFVNKVANSFIDKSQNKIDTNEIAVLICNLYGKYGYENDLLTKYYVIAEMITRSFKLEIDLIKNNCNNDDKELIQMGFIAAEDYYGTSPLIMEFVAEGLLNDIFKSDKMNIEDTVHEIFKTKEEFNDKCNFNYFMTGIVASFDRELVDYILNNNKNLYNYALEQYQKIANNYDNYILNKKTIKAERLDDLINQFANKYFYNYAEVLQTLLKDKNIDVSILLEVDEYAEFYYTYISEPTDKYEKELLEYNMNKIRNNFDYNILKKNIKKALVDKEDDAYVIAMRNINNNNNEVIPFNRK